MFLVSCVIHSVVSNHFSIPTPLPFFLASLDELSDMGWFTERMVPTDTRCAPKFHPWVRDVRRPGEIDDVNVVEGHASHFSIWIDPIYVPAAGR